MAIGNELLAVPFADMVTSIGTAIAKAQLALDSTSFRIAQMMSGGEWDTGQVNKDGEPIIGAPRLVRFGGQELSLLELGFTPTFYQFVDTIIEVKIAIHITSESESNTSRTDVNVHADASLGWFSGEANLHASSVSASYASKYQYSAEGSSLIRTKLVPVPPPAILEQRIRDLIKQKPA
jgi:hypothetical protein